jgi:hypothetical protein
MGEVLTAHKSTATQANKPKAIYKEDTMTPPPGASQQGSKAADNNAIRPFSVNVPEAEPSDALELYEAGILPLPPKAVRPLTNLDVYSGDEIRSL